MGLVCELIFGRITRSKHFANIAVRVAGRRSLSTFGSGFLFTGIISLIFQVWHAADIKRYVEDAINYVE